MLFITLFLKMTKSSKLVYYSSTFFVLKEMIQNIITQLRLLPSLKWNAKVAEYARSYVEARS